MYTHQSQSPNSSHHHHPRRFPPLVSIRLFSTSVSLFLPCKPVHLYHFPRLHIYALIYDICFSLSDLLHSVWQSLGPSTSLQMTQFHFVLYILKSSIDTSPLTNGLFRLFQSVLLNFHMFRDYPVVFLLLICNLILYDQRTHCIWF